MSITSGGSGGTGSGSSSSGGGAPSGSPVVTLATKVIRDAAGIQTLEQGAIASLLELMVGETGTAYANNATFQLLPQAMVGGVWTPQIKTSVKLLYNRAATAKSGGDYINNLVQESRALPAATNISQPAPAIQSNPLAIPTEPSAITTVEQFHLWCALNLQAGAASMQTPDPTVVDIHPVDDATAPYLLVALTLPYDIITYVKTMNLVAAVKQIITSLPTGVPAAAIYSGGSGNQPPSTAPTGFGNSMFLGNLNPVGNV